MSKILSPALLKFPEEIVHSFNFLFEIFWNSIFLRVWIYLTYTWHIYLTPIYHSLDKKIWFAIIYLLLKENLTLFQICIFLLYHHLFVPIGVIEDRVTKINSKYFNEKLRPFHLSWLINSIFLCSSPWSMIYLWARCIFI